MAVAIKGAKYLWPERTIPYQIDPAFPDPGPVKQAIQHWNTNTSIRFVPFAKQTDYLFIRLVPGGASSDVGRRGGKQEAAIGEDCPMGSIAHELGHAVGLWHEHCRNDRDQWVEIDFSNIDPDCVEQFKQNWIDGAATPTFDIGDYDYDSIMHYSDDSFPIDPSLPVMKALHLPANVVMGQRLSLSAGDIAAVEVLYKGIPKPAG